MQIIVSIKCLKIKYEIKNDDICLKMYTGYVQIILTIDERFYCFLFFFKWSLSVKTGKGHVASGDPVKTLLVEHKHECFF